MRSAEGSGRTVDEAIRDALRALGIPALGDAELLVLDEGSRGVLGLGGRPARVRLTLAAGGDEDAEAVEATPAAVVGEDAVAAAREVTAALLESVNIPGSIAAREEAGAVQVTITGPQLAPLIGRHGQTLEAFDLLANLMTARRLGRRVLVAVDAERYRERRREQLISMARRTAARVRRTGRQVPLDPMSASERRVIHTALADDGYVTTHSEGTGPERHIVIAPRGEAEGNDRHFAAGSRDATPAERPQGRRSRSSRSGRPYMQSARPAAPPRPAGLPEDPEDVPEEPAR